MRYLLRLLGYIAIFLLTFSVGSVVLLRWVPITVTPLKVLRWVENLSEQGPKVYSYWVPLERINPQMVTAVVATEDNNFLTHRGFDWKAIKQAIKTNRKGERLRGGSTISQQTAKNVFCLPHRTFLRKAIEAYYTFLIEILWGKRRIMEVYLNVIETGPNMYGIEAPAQRIYHKPAAELNRHEAAMIAAALPSPRHMRLEAPSSYMNRRAAQVRSLMGSRPPIEWEKAPPQPSKKTP